MNSELQELLKAWDAYVQELESRESERLRALFESQLDCYAGSHNISKETIR